MVMLSNRVSEEPSNALSHAMERDLTHEKLTYKNIDIRDVFPLSRIDVARWRWVHTLLIPISLPALIIMFIVKTIMFITYSLFWGNNPRILAALLGHSIDTQELRVIDDNVKIIVMNHHSTQVECNSLLTHLYPRPATLVAASALNVGWFRMINKNPMLWKVRGMPLKDLYENWRKDNPHAVLLVFPQGHTCASGFLSKFNEPIFRCEDSVFVVSAQLMPWLPLHFRTASSGYFVDLLWLLFHPYTRIKLCGSMVHRDSSGSSCDMMKDAESFVVETTGFLRVDFTLADKAAMVKHSHGTSIRITRQIQNNQIMFNRYVRIIMGFIHFLIQESSLMLVACILNALNWNPLMFNFLARMAALVFMLTICIKAYCRVPRPMWLDERLYGTKHIWQPDYSFPSGHSAFTAAIATSIMIFNIYTPPIGTVLCVLLPFITGLSRIILGMHHVFDVIAGWLLGICSTWLWHKYAEETWRFASTNNQFFGVSIVSALCLAFLLFCRLRCMDTNHLEDIMQWQNIAKRTLEPQKLNFAILPFWIGVIVWFSGPIMATIGLQHFVLMLDTPWKYVLSVFVTLAVFGTIIVFLTLIVRPTHVAIKSMFYIALLVWAMMGSRAILHTV